MIVTTMMDAMLSAGLGPAKEMDLRDDGRLVRYLAELGGRDGL